jgi:WD repeat-containing protein 35
VQFYNNHGLHLKNIKVPGSDLVKSITWEGNGLRIAMAVGSSIYFANIKPDHKWAWMNGTFVFGYPKSDRIESTVVFWDTKSN